MTQASTSLLSWSGMVEALRSLRNTDERNSAETVRLGEKIAPKTSGAEYWSVREQLCIAYLDTGAIEKASAVVDELKQKFPGSSRVARLVGMLLEAKGDFDGASQHYKETLEAHPTAAAIMKRQVAVARATGETELAHSLLKAYLEIYAIDTEAWLEMADLCMELNSFEEASFCYAELILAMPHSHVSHARYAEVEYTLGGYKNLIKARQHFAKAHDVLDVNPRALFGLQKSCRALLGKHEAELKTDEDELTTTTKLLQYADKKLNALFKGNKIYQQVGERES